MTVHGLRPAQQAERLADKGFQTLRARCALHGLPLRRHVLEDAVEFSVGVMRFETLDQVGELLDQIHRAE